MRKIKETSKALLARLASNARAEANAIPPLIARLGADVSEEECISVLGGVTAFFIDLHETGVLPSPGAPPPPQTPEESSKDSEAIFAAWAWRQRSRLLEKSLTFVGAGAPGAQLESLKALMELARAGSVRAELDVSILRETSRVVLTEQGVADETLRYFMGLLDFPDVAFYALRSLPALCTSLAPLPDAASEAALCNVFDALRRCSRASPQPAASRSSWCGALDVAAAADPAEGSRRRQKRLREIGASGEAVLAPRAKWASASLQKRALSDAWLTFFRCELPADLARKALGELEEGVIPRLTNPLLLSDLLTHTLRRGGLEAVLALKGIFVLVTRHGLEYPHFYARLYSLLQPVCLEFRHRDTFLGLVDVFLASRLVSAYTAAAFAKRFARIALEASPAGALRCLAFVHNLVRRHPACLQLLHRPRRKSEAGGAEEEEGEEERANLAPFPDPYDPEVADPAKARALDSSLWEVAALRRHWNPHVVAACAALDRDLTDRKRTAEADMGALLPTTYASMFAAENKRRLKEVPVAVYRETPDRLVDDRVLRDLGSVWAM